jgi:hypothetical protein
MRRYWILQVFSWVLMIAAVVVWVTTLVNMIDYAQNGSPVLSELTGLIDDMSALVGSQLGRFTRDLTQQLIWQAFMERMFLGMVLLGAGQFIDLMRHMADDLRALRIQGNHRVLNAERRPDMWN